MNGIDLNETKTFVYDNIISFHYMNFTVAIKNGKAGLIDIAGNPLTDFIYEDLTDHYDKDEDSTGWMLYEDNYCVMRLNGKWGILNYKGNTIVDFKYDDEIATYSVGDRIIVVADDKYTLIDLNGNIITDKYDTIMPHIDSLACITLGDNVGIIDSNGEGVIDCKYKWVQPSSSGYFAVSNHDDKWGVLDRNQNVILDLEYDFVDISISKDSETVVFNVNLNGKSALYNTSGERIA